MFSNIQDIVMTIIVLLVLILLSNIILIVVNWSNKDTNQVRRLENEMMELKHKLNNLDKK